jgi:hypothetical protein
MASDFLLNEDLDIVIHNKDFVFGNCDVQNISLLLQYAPGQLKDFPFSGIDIQSYLLDEVSEVEIDGAIRSGLVADGATVSTVKVSLEKIEVDANY